MNVEVLISTMNNNDIFALLTKMNVQTDAIVINQYDGAEKFQECNYNGHMVKVYNTNDRGISNSRNKAISNATSDIIVLADDNESLVDNYKGIIIEAYKKNKADIICFNIVRKNDERKVKKPFKKVGYIGAMRISSPQITIRRDQIKKYNLLFDSDFGTGSKYTLGEETIFLYDCMKSGMKVIFVDKLLNIKVNSRKSTWYCGMNEKYLADRGAAFYRMDSKKYFLLIIQFALRKEREYGKNNINIWLAIRYMLNGANEYKKIKGD